MKIQFIAPLYRKLWLVDWSGLLPYWQRSYQYDSVKDEKLENILLPFWLKGKGEKDQRLEVGHIDYFEREPCIMFTNGIHRTQILARHMRYVPLGAGADTYRNRLISRFFIRRIEKNEVWELPDIPIRFPKHLQEED